MLGHLPDRLAPDSLLLQHSTNQQIAQALSATSRAYAESREWQPSYDADDLLELIGK